MFALDYALSALRSGRPGSGVEGPPMFALDYALSALRSG